MSQFVSCDDCGKRLAGVAPFSITQTLDTMGLGTLTLPAITKDACSTACLVRLAASLHRPPVAPTDELEAIT